MEYEIKKLVEEFNEFCKNKKIKNTFENYIYWKYNIKIVEQRDLLETTRNLERSLTEEEFDEIMTVYKKVIDRQWNEWEKQGIDL